MKKVLFSATVAIGLLFTGCSYQATPSAVTMDVSKVDFSTIDNLKKGKDCISQFLIFRPSADISIRAIAKEAGISKVVYVDHELNRGLFYESHCTIVYGN